MRNMIISKAIAAFALATTSAPAAAQTSTVYVAWEDLNLESEAGMAALENRVAQAIDDVCPRGQIQSITRRMDANACRVAAEENAARQVELLRSGSVKIIAIRDEAEPRG